MVSVLSLVDDGATLAHELAAIAELAEPEQERALATIIRPRLEFCDTSSRCHHTGLLLTDIWRYFRLTWSLEYRATPGRSVAFLIRNDGRPDSPVMGIGMIASAGNRLKPRDAWIGWDLGELQSRLTGGGHKGQPTWSPETIASALLRAVDSGISSIRKDDLLRDADELHTPTRATIEWLANEATEASEERVRRLKELSSLPPDQRPPLHALPRQPDDTVDWLAASEADLFRKKRASALGQLIAAKMLFDDCGLASTPKAAFDELLRSEPGRSAINVALGELRKNGLAGSVLDVNVCGAIAPYNELLAGKLVALLMGSSDAAQAYYDRYLDRPSDIASQMAGREIRRAAPILVLTTTSLYGIGSSQYNRLVLRAADHPELRRDIVWEELGTSAGVGTSHFSPGTVDALRDVVKLVKGARRINSVFGEGTNPRLRQLREGLGVLRLNAEHFVRHATPRIVYGWEVAPGGIDRLMGIDTSATMPELQSAAAISAAWRRRWVRKRIMNPDALARIAESGPATVQRRFPAPRQSAMLFEPRGEEEAMPATNPTGDTVPESPSELFRLVKELYLSVGAVSEHHTPEALAALHVRTPVEEFVETSVTNGRVVFLTGNPGDGKTHLVRLLQHRLGPPETRFVWDANDRDDDELIGIVDEASRVGTGLVVAINEGTLVELVRSAGRDRQWAREVDVQQKRPLQYGNVALPVPSTIVVDLNLRNNLARPVAEALLDRLTDPAIYEAPHGCEPGLCPAAQNAALLRSPRVRDRLLRLLEDVGRTGTHATMRDLAGYFSFLIFGGRTCQALLACATGNTPSYANHAFGDGKGDLFDPLRRADPVHRPHPLRDDALWRNAVPEGDWAGAPPPRCRNLRPPPSRNCRPSQRESAERSLNSKRSPMFRWRRTQMSMSSPNSSAKPTGHACATSSLQSTSSSAPITATSTASPSG